MRESWMDDAACSQIGSEFFFPEKGDSSVPAKSICGRCPVVDECLAFGMDEQFGIWGGLSVDERRGLNRKPRLSPNLAQVVRLKGLGMSVPDIADAVGISERQVFRLVQMGRVAL